MNEQNLYFDTSNVRGFAQFVANLIDTKYADEAKAIHNLLHGLDAEATPAIPGTTEDPAASMGRSGVEYYGLDIAETQATNARYAGMWLSQLMTSLEDIVTAGAVAAENMTGTDSDNADDLRDGFTVPPYQHA